MKILLATYPMAHQTPGGGEIQIHYYKKYLTKIGHKVKLFNNWNDKIKNYDLVHFFSCVGGSQHFCNYVKSLGIPLVISPNLWITNKNKNQYNLTEIQNILSLGDKIVCNSKIEMKMMLKIFDLKKKSIEYVYNGVDPIFLKKTNPNIFKKKYKISYNFLLNVANIEKRKNQLELVKACNQINQKIIIIGKVRDNNYLNQIKLIDKNKNLKIISNINHNSLILRSAYSACSHFVLPSILETPGLSALEAAASGKNILITKEGSAMEYFLKNANYYDKKIEKSLRNLIKLPNYSTKNKMFIKNYLWSKCIQRLEGIYKKIKK